MGQAMRLAHGDRWRSGAEEGGARSRQHEWLSNQSSQFAEHGSTQDRDQPKRSSCGGLLNRRSCGQSSILELFLQWLVGCDMTRSMDRHQPKGKTKVSCHHQKWSEQRDYTHLVTVAEAEMKLLTKIKGAVG